MRVSTTHKNSIADAEKIRTLKIMLQDAKSTDHAAKAELIAAEKLFNAAQRKAAKTSNAVKNLEIKLAQLMLKV